MMLNYYLNPLKNRSMDLFNNFFDLPFEHGDFSGLPTNIIEKENEYVLEVQIPGFKKDEVTLSLKDEYLTIEVKKNEEKQDENNKYVHREIRYSSASRSYYVGNIDKSLISAKFNNGILEVSVPKKQLEPEDKTNYIDIQ